MPMFDKNGVPTKGKFRVHCHQDGCNNFIMGRWGSGYGGVDTKEGSFDCRNKVWYCCLHDKPHHEERSYWVWECARCGQEYPEHEKEKAEKCCR